MKLLKMWQTYLRFFDWNTGLRKKTATESLPDASPPDQGEAELQRPVGSTSVMPNSCRKSCTKLSPPDGKK
ncbi:hypothetical protein pipiens_013183 [Culex pipiens pipiens]|uniref:Uncharacterized protein n=1 Tax=Culex pipiens pipiens TaxID=38569 RepID=A0ABD1CZE0_CULPP